jgi:hypothetical protein
MIISIVEQRTHTKKNVSSCAVWRPNTFNTVRASLHKRGYGEDDAAHEIGQHRKHEWTEK